MDRKAVGFLGVAISIAALRSGAPAFQSAPPPGKLLTPSATPGSTSTFASCVLAEGPWKAANAYYQLKSGLRLQRLETVEDPMDWSSVQPDSDADFLFATVADPEKTHLALNFDRGVESLMWAIEDSGYSFERYWLPWQESPAIVTQTVADEQCRKKQKESREAEPGLLIFHRKVPERTPAPRPKGTLMVFLIGETPTSGVNKNALEHAFQYAKSVRPDLSNLDIVGPNFSGSLAPLSKDLARLINGEDGVKFHIVSGTATSRAAIQDFRSALQAPPGLLNRFESTVENDTRAGTLFFDFMRARWGSPKEEIAMLTEDETVYGRFAFAGGDTYHKWLLLRYPREIARLRNATPDAGQAPSEAKSAPATASGVPLTLHEALSPSQPGRQLDSVGTFSEQQSPASQQAALLSISAALRRERAGFAGILASDVLDTLFLTRFLRLTYPDMRIFTLDADLLFLRETESSPMVGIVSVTNYPLFSRNQHWTDSEIRGRLPRRVLFTSRYAQGIYNATRRLTKPLQDNDAGAEPYLEYSHPFTPEIAHPPLWLTVLGRDGYWPVALLDEKVGPAVPESTLTSFPPGARHIKERPHPEPPSRGWRLFFWLICGFCLLHFTYVTMLIGREQLPAAGIFRRIKPIQDALAIGSETWEQQTARFYQTLRSSLGGIFAAYPESSPTPREKTFLLAATLAASCALLVFALPTVRFLADDWFYAVTAGLVVLAMNVLAVRLTIRKLRPAPPMPTKGLTARAISAARTFLAIWNDSEGFARIACMVWLVAFVFCGLWAWLIADGAYRTGYFLAYRALFLGNGVSPGIPIILLAAAFYGWAWVHLRRETFSTHGKYRFDLGRQVVEMDYMIQETDQSLSNLLSHRIWMPAIGFTALWYLLLWPHTSLRTVESIWYQYMYVVLITTIYWIVMCNLIQFFRTWRRFQKILQALDLHPIRNAFSRLPKEISWIPLVSAKPARNLFVSTRTWECLQHLNTRLARSSSVADAKLADGLGIQQVEIGERLGKLQAQIRSSERVRDQALYKENYGAMQTAFDGAANLICRDLQSREWERGSSESLHEHSEDERRGETSELTVLKEEFVALRILIYMRYVLRQLRNLLGFIIGGFILSIVSLGSYPFQAHRWIGLSSIITMLALGAGVAIVFAEMDRDAILSRITDTKANEVGKTFFFRIVQFGALPLFTVLAAQFPSINRFLFSWIQPALEALR